jgi:hypothetical protein
MGQSETRSEEETVSARTALQSLEENWGGGEGRWEIECGREEIVVCMFL